MYLKQNDVFEDLGKHGRIILKSILSKKDIKGMDWICLAEDKLQ